MRIAEIQRDMVGQHVEVIGLATDVKMSVASNGKNFVTLTLIDNAQTLRVIQFDAARAGEIWRKPSGVIVAHGTVDEFNGALQIKARQLVESQESADGFVRHSPVISERDRPDFCESWDHEPAYADIVRLAVWLANEACGSEWWRFPAARHNHHAYRRGLGEHVASMLEIAEALEKSSTMSGTCLRLGVDWGAVKAGIILHDIAKCLDVVEESPGVWTETDHSRLIGHIPQAAMWIAEAVATICVRDDDDPEYCERVRAAGEQLTHIVLSHHGNVEWGSPIKPATPEAILVHQIDLLDSRMAIVREALEATSDDEEWTDFVRTLGARFRRTQ